MRRTTVGLASLALATTFGLTYATSVGASPSADTTAGASVEKQVSDDLPNPQEEKRRELRERGWSMVLNGEAKAEQRGTSTVVKVGEKSRTQNSRERLNAQGKVDQYVELSREKTDKIFVVLAEFGNERHPSYPDQDTDPNTPGPATFDGPLVNAIPEPDRTVDNSTVWRPDFSQAYYNDLYFGSGAISGVETVKKYFEKQSSGRYSVDGMVTDWVKVQYNEARYGRSNGFPCGGSVCSNTWVLIRDAINVWVAEQHAAGRTDAQIKADLASYDVWDRNDYNGNGNFNEPDGYIDHFQIVHAGGDQADGDPHQGEDAIWSHRWKAFQGTGEGPTGNKDGGTQIGTTGLWVADYTIQPENGGVSVFTHEYSHDLGLPDHYDTVGPGGASENGINFWSLMAQSRVSAKNDEGIGTRSADLDAWSKLQLGWLDYEIVLAGQNRTVDLGPHEYNSKKAQGLAVVLPKKPVTTQYGAPAAGNGQWWSGKGDDLNNTMSRQVTLGAAPAELTFQAKYDIEDCGPDPCDYAYVEVDDGTGYKVIPGSITKAAEGNGIDGTSNGYVPATFDLSAFANKTVSLRFRYTTDGAAGGLGFFADSIKVTAGGATVLESGAEASPEGWTLSGFTAVGASVTTMHDNFYLASHINYVSHDQYLKTGPYNFGFGNTKPDWVEHFPYQDGLLVWYWDTSQADNNTSVHPGEGLVLPVDAHPVPINNLAGGIWRPRVGGYDATFGLEKADTFTLHTNGQASLVRGQDAVSTFNDSKTYWFAEQPTAGVKVPNNRVNIKVLEREGTSMKVRVSSRP